MATTASEATAAPMPLTLGGRELMLSPRTQRDDGELEQWLRSRALQMVRDSFTPSMTPQQRAEELRAAMDYAGSLTVASPSAMQMLRTTDAAIYVLWQSAKKNHPKLTQDELRGLMLDEAGNVSDDDLEAAMAVLDHLNGYDQTEEGTDAGNPQSPQT